jgi:D-aminoacyl-tRNA deacylase
MRGSKATATEMRAVVQRVEKASVHIGGGEHARVNAGLLVLLGIEVGDTDADLEWLCGKITRMRIFNDAESVMNLDITQVHGELLLVSQFTLHASTAKGNRPSYIRAARPEEAVPLYLRAKQRLTELIGRAVKSGEFGADMRVHLVNDGPVTIVIDSRAKE